MIVWTEYLKYPAQVRKFDLVLLEQIVRHSAERYIDTGTGRMIVVGSHDSRQVMIAYELAGEDITPVTVHAITRQQIRFRLQTGRFKHE